MHGAHKQYMRLTSNVSFYYPSVSASESFVTRQRSRHATNAIYDYVSVHATLAFLVKHDIHIHDLSRTFIPTEIVRRRRFFNFNICARILLCSLCDFSLFYLFFLLFVYIEHANWSPSKCARDHVRILTRNCYVQIFALFAREELTSRIPKRIFFPHFLFFFFRLASLACLPAGRFPPIYFCREPMRDRVACGKKRAAHVYVDESLS